MWEDDTFNFNADWTPDYSFNGMSASQPDFSLNSPATMGQTESWTDYNPDPGYTADNTTWWEGDSLKTLYPFEAPTQDYSQNMSLMSRGAQTPSYFTPSFNNASVDPMNMTMAPQQNDPYYTLNKPMDERSQLAWNYSNPEEEQGTMGKISDWMKKNPSLLRLASGAFGAFKDKRTADRLRGLATEMGNMASPYRDMYARGHANYYQKPGEWTNSPYVRDVYNEAAKEYMAKMAAQGRSNPNEMAYTQAAMRNKIARDSYLDWMKTSYPWGAMNPQTAASMAGLQGQAERLDYNKYNGIAEWLLRESGVPQKEVGTRTQGVPRNTMELLMGMFGGGY